MADIVNKALFALQRKIELENFAITIFLGLAILFASETSKIFRITGNVNPREIR